MTTFVTLIAPKLDTTNLAYYMVAWLVQCKLGPAQSELDSSEENGQKQIEADKNR